MPGRTGRLRSGPAKIICCNGHRLSTGGPGLLFNGRLGPGLINPKTLLYAFGGQADTE